MPPTLPTLTESAKRRLMALALAVGLGVAWLMMSNRMMVNERKKLAAERKKLLENYQSPIEVVVALKDIPAHTVIEAPMLSFAKIPERFAQPYSVRDPNLLIGLMTVADTAAGEQVLTNKIMKPEDVVPVGTTLSNVVPKGKRAVTITVNTLTGVGGFVRPGDLVDVLWTLGLPGPDKDHPELVTLTLFQDVEVLAVQREITGQPAHRAAASNENDGQSASGESAEEMEAAGASPVAGSGQQGDYTATLALNPQDISFLLFAREQQGRIQLALRSKDEAGAKAPVAPVNMATMMGAALGQDVLKANQPKPQRQVEVYKGLNRDVVVLTDEGGSSDH